MNKFFTSDLIYKERLEACKKCVYYFKATGQCKRCLCFMKLKARIAPAQCPEKYWLKTTKIEMPDDLPQDLVNEVLDIWGDIKTGVAKNQEVKRKMIELYNTITGSNYKTGTSCSSCLNTCYNGLKEIYNEYSSSKFYKI